MEPPSFANIPIVDGHVHFVHPERMQEMLSILDDVPCRRFNLVCVPELDGSNHNAAAVYFKQHYPDRTYISGALDYRPVLGDLGQGAQILARQVLEMKAQGFDGLKMIEGKPQVRKLLPFALDGDLYAGLWEALEQEQFPVLLHVGDPDEFWDPKNCPAWARKSGWDYSDGTYPSKQALYAEVETVLARHPGLKMVLAHFSFRSHQLPQAGQFLDTHPNLCIDLAPHMDMYHHFSEQPEVARDFFLHYPDRILYGTDIDTRALQRGESGHRFMRFIPWLIRSILEEEGCFQAEDGTPYHGLNLPGFVLEKIYHANFERVFGADPARLTFRAFSTPG